MRREGLPSSRVALRRLNLSGTLSKNKIVTCSFLQLGDVFRSIAQWLIIKEVELRDGHRKKERRRRRRERNPLEPRLSSMQIVLDQKFLSLCVRNGAIFILKMTDRPPQNAPLTWKQDKPKCSAFLDQNLIGD